MLDERVGGGQIHIGTAGAFFRFTFFGVGVYARDVQIILVSLLVACDSNIVEIFVKLVILYAVNNREILSHVANLKDIIKFNLENVN